MTPPVPGAPRYSDATRARAVERYEAGESAYAIARDLGCDGRAIRRWVAAAGLDVRALDEAQRRRLAAAAAARGEDLPEPAYHRPNVTRGDVARREKRARLVDIPRRRVDDEGDGLDLTDEEIRAAQAGDLARSLAAGGGITLRLVVCEGGERRLIVGYLTRRGIGAPTVEQESLDPAQPVEWARRVLQILDTAADAARGLIRLGRGYPQGGRHGR